MPEFNNSNNMVGRKSSTEATGPGNLQRLISRSRLLDRLNDGACRRLTLISAPTGSGKTTLLRDWVRRSSIPAVMVSLTRGHNEPQRFLQELDGAVRRLSFDHNERLRAGGGLWMNQMVTCSVNRMAAIPFDFAVVLDNVHMLDTPATRNALVDLVEYLPPCAHLVLSTQEEPEIPLPRMRVRRQVVELRAADLAFTLEETTEYLKDRAAAVTAEVMGAIHRRTEGWINGIRLAAQELRSCSDCAGGGRQVTGTAPFIATWFEAEVLSTQPSDIVQFLMRTSPLEELTASECDRVTGRRDGRLLLARLERKNLFLDPLDDERTRYRYHGLFREFLIDRMRRTAGDSYHTTPAGRIAERP